MDNRSSYSQLRDYLRNAQVPWVEHNHLTQAFTLRDIVLAVQSHILTVSTRRVHIDENGEELEFGENEVIYSIHV